MRDSAVYIFFLMSGFVLRRAFARIDSGLEGIGRRVVRLGLPTSAAVVIACILLAVDDQAHRSAAAMSGSTRWLGALMQAQPTFGAAMRDALLNSVLLGYRQTTSFPPLTHLIALSSLNSAFDVPVWTLNIELAGSLICLVLSLIGRRSPTLFALAVIAFAYSEGASQLFLFVIGYLLAGHYPRPSRPLAKRLAIMALIGGILLCRLTAFGPVLALRTLLRHQQPPDGYHFTNQIGAILIFIAILNLPIAQNVLSTRLPQWLGRISFSLYLLHFPIMATLGCSLFAVAAPQIGIIAATLLAVAIGLPVTLIAASLFERWVDRAAVRLSHHVRWLQFAPART
jgi:peptidoglycan/LPS O-acetylase OafA/YrhL